MPTMGPPAPWGRPGMQACSTVPGPAAAATAAAAPAAVPAPATAGPAVCCTRNQRFVRPRRTMQAVPLLTPGAQVQSWETQSVTGEFFQQPTARLANFAAALKRGSGRQRMMQ